MPQVHDWKATRAGSGITVSHSAGKLTGVSEITVEAGKVVATGANGAKFELVVA